MVLSVSQVGKTVASVPGSLMKFFLLTAQINAVLSFLWDYSLFNFNKNNQIYGYKTRYKSEYSFTMGKEIKIKY